MRSAYVILHDLGSGKGNSHGARHVNQDSAGLIAADVGYVFAGATSCSKYGRRRIYNVARICSVLSSLVQIVEALGVRRRSGPTSILSDKELPHFVSRRNPGRIREQIGCPISAGTSRGVE